MVDLDYLVKEWGVVSGAILLTLTNGLSVIATYKTMKANARKSEAETRKIDAEAIAEAAKVEAARVQFEKALNERALQSYDLLRDQVKALSELVEGQNEQLKIASARIQEMEDEIKELRITLDKRTGELHKARAIFPPICKRCEFFTGDSDGCVRGRRGEICKYENSQVSAKVLPMPMTSPPIPVDET